jgi:hypothetical protein
MSKKKTKTKKILPEVVQFEKDMQQVLKEGLIININHMPNKKGIEISLPTNVSVYHANQIAQTIRSRYNLQALFFAKKHSINVYYEC